QIYNDGTSAPVVIYSAVQGGYSGTGNIDADPCFVDTDNPDPNLWDLRLMPDSPCIDEGDNNSVPADTADLDDDGDTAEPIPYDLDGYPRILDGDLNGSFVVDMGAYEYNGLVVHNVTQDRFYILIQAAINDAYNGDQIEVWPGTHYEAIDFKGKAIRLYSSGGPEVTTINANGAYHAVQCVSGEDANTILEGFTITGGDANGSFPDNVGGGMYNSNSSPKVTNCIFCNNSADVGGGGIFNEASSSPAVTNCILRGNSSNYGAGMWNYGSSPTLTNCTFSNNTGYNVGGMYNEYGSNPVVTNCIFWGDSPSEISNSSSTPLITYSDVQGGTGESWFGIGCIDADPCFVDANNPDPNLWNLRLKPDSPCIDAADNSSVPSGVTTDLAGHPRITDGDCNGTEIVDMGAYEFAWVYLGDFAGGCDVDFVDFSVLGLTWLLEEGQPGYNPVCDISIPADGTIDEKDLKIFTDNWLAGM
ncbi:MAG: choice-of-anchor Q domain-containing protein, partial [Planctomycetota bacterium]